MDTPKSSSSSSLLSSPLIGLALGCEAEAAPFAAGVSKSSPCVWRLLGVVGGPGRWGMGCRCSTAKVAPGVSGALMMDVKRLELRRIAETSEERERRRSVEANARWRVVGVALGSPTAEGEITPPVDAVTSWISPDNSPKLLSVWVMLPVPVPLPWPLLLAALWRPSPPVPAAVASLYSTSSKS